jgi:hypothetical protein
MKRKGGYKAQILTLVADILLRKESLVVPPLFLTDNGKYEIFPLRSISINKAEIQKRFNSQRQVVVLQSPHCESEFIIEVLTGKLGFAKSDLDLARENNICYVGLDARKLRKSDHLVEDVIDLINDVRNFTWIWNPDRHRLERFLEEEYSRSKAVLDSKVPDCPLVVRRPELQRTFEYVDVCRKCPYCVLKDKLDSSRKVACLGHLHSIFNSLIREGSEKLFPGQLPIPGI